MKTQRNILIAFILNLAFSIFELFGGVLTGSVAIISDAVHDLGDAVSIAISYVMEKKSKKQPDEVYTYGYARYSVMGGLVTTIILVLGSVLVICNGVKRIFAPVPIRYNGMILFAVIGVIVNTLAAYITHRGDSINQKAVNLHMLEDVLGWLVVLVGAIVIRFTDFIWLDPVMSIAVALFILKHAVKHLGEISDLFLEKVPADINISAIKECIRKLHGVLDVYHIHVWSLDGQMNLATMHILTEGDPSPIKAAIRDKMCEQGIFHVTIEIETNEEHCKNSGCCMDVGHFFW